MKERELKIFPKTNPKVKMHYTVVQNIFLIGTDFGCLCHDHERKNICNSGTNRKLWYSVLIVSPNIFNDYH